MSEKVVFARKFLNPEKILADYWIIDWIQQVNGIGVKSSFLIREYEIFVLFHGKHELPAILDLIGLVDDRVSQADSCYCFHERYRLLLQIAVGVHEYGDVVIVA